MGIRDLFRKNRGEEGSRKAQEESREPLAGTLEKEPSVIMAVPEKESSLADLDEIVNRVKETGDIKVLGRRTGESPCVRVMYHEKEYTLEFIVTDYELPPLFRVNHKFTDQEISVMENARKGLMTRMVFEGDNQEAFHLQLKLLVAMVPDMAGVLDYSAEKILSGKWVRLAAGSSVPPAPTYLYTIQAVNGGDKDIWIHTHGLNRCGGIELEVLHADTDNYQKYGDVINAVAGRIITSEGFVKEGEPFYVGRLSETVDLVVTWKNWEDALGFYPKKILGGEKDRQGGHNENTGVLFVYESEEAWKEGRVSTLSVYDSLIGENSLIMITTEETRRMGILARERLSYLRQLFDGKEECHVLVKIGIDMDDEYKNESQTKEYIWFELNQWQEGQERELVCTLTQEPYYASHIKEGDSRAFDREEVVDWIAYLPDRTVTPDSVYLVTKEDRP